MTNEITGATPPSFVHYDDRAQVTATLTASARLVSNSEVQTFLRCRRKWWLAWYLGLRPKLESPTGVRAIGDRVHRALAKWYVTEDSERTDSRDALEEEIITDWHLLVDHYGGTSEVPPGVATDFHKDADLERAMISGYVQWLEETGADANIRTLASERYIQVRFPVTGETLPVYLIGKLDARVQRVSDDVKLFIDHKTVGDFIRKTRTLHMDPQMLHYHLIEFLSLEDSDERCDGALYNMLRRVKRTAKANPPFYQRTEVRHNYHELQSYTLKLQGIISDMLITEQALTASMAHPSTLAYPHPTGDCSWDCDFINVCPLFDDGSRVGDMIREYFAQGDPLSYYHRDMTKE